MLFADQRKMPLEGRAHCGGGWGGVTPQCTLRSLPMKLHACMQPWGVEVQGMRSIEHALG